MPRKNTAAAHRTNRHFNEQGTPIPAINFTEWEFQKLRSHVAQQTIVFLRHYGVGAGLTRSEVAEMNRWRDLDAKFDGEPKPDPLPYKGYRGNGFNLERD
jgi:hypothetical protein